jgi:hypothetical protein
VCRDLAAPPSPVFVYIVYLFMCIDIACTNQDVFQKYSKKEKKEEDEKSVNRYVCGYDSITKTTK